MDNIFGGGDNLFVPPVEGQGTEDMTAGTEADQTLEGEQSDQVDGELEGDDQDGQGEEGDEGQPERLYADTFKTPEELERAYKELRRRDTQVSQQLADLRKTQTSPPDQGQAPPSMEQLMAAYKENPIAVMNYMMTTQLQQSTKPLQDQMQAMAISNEVNTLRHKYPDFADMAPELQKVFEQTPQLWNMPNPVEMAYMYAKATLAPAAVQKAKEAGKQEAYKTQDAKRKAGIEGQGSRRTQTTKTPEDTIIEEIFKSGGESGSIFK